VAEQAGGLWPTRSPYLNACVYIYSYRMSKDKHYSNRHRTEYDMKESTRVVWSSVLPAEIRPAMNTMFLTL
jgi:hypothetical protein